MNARNTLTLLTLTLFSGFISPLIAKGDGSFGNPWCTPGNSYQDIEQRFGDFDGDGDPDMVVTEIFSKVYIYQNNGNGTFQSTPSYTWDPNSDRNWRGVVVFDYDNDGDLDIYAVVMNSTDLLFINQGNFQFLEVGVPNSAGATDQVEAFDMDNDGRIDIVHSHNQGFSMLRNTFNGSSYATPDLFGTPISSPVLGQGDIALEDIDGDGDGDVIFAGLTAGQSGVYLYGAGAFSAGQNFGPSTIGHDVVFGYLDFDSNIDAVLVGSAGRHFLYGNGDGTFTNLKTSSTATNAVAIADLNSDSVSDLIFQELATFKTYFGQGDGTYVFGAAVTNSAGNRQFDLADADLDTDLDIAVRGGGTNDGGRSCVYFNSGTDPAITAAFDGDPLYGGAPLTVHFTDLSQAANTTITSWAWDFDADGTVDSTQQHPTHTYFDPGTYSVRLVVSNGSAIAVAYEEAFVVVDSDPCAAECEIDLLWEEVTGGINRATGNVGIHNAAPTYELDVTGSVNAQNLLINGTPIQEGIWTESGSHAYRASGYVGINTSNPSEQLDIDGGVLVNKSGNDVRFRIDSVVEQNAFLFDGGRNAIGMGVVPNPAARLDVAVKSDPITSSGSSVKIGVLSRLYETNIDSGITDNGYRAAIHARGVIENAGFAGHLHRVYGLHVESGMTAGSGTVDIAMGLFIQNYDLPGQVSHHYGIYQHGTTAKNFFGGRVGIGTTSPNGALDVNGEIYQRGALLHADYVFADDYQLLSIEEQGAFMENNEHLPAVPKAEVDENGREVLLVGAHRRGMLEELEKAHLYIQQLNEKVKQQDARIDLLLRALEQQQQ